MATKKIIVFLGSTREGRQGEKVARYVQSVLEKTGLSAKIFGKCFFLKSHFLVGIITQLLLILCRSP
jgi:hypothetical protein